MRGILVEKCVLVERLRVSLCSGELEFLALDLLLRQLSLVNTCEQIITR
jgi:hypothetical protein